MARVMRRHRRVVGFGNVAVKTHHHRTKVVKDYPTSRWFAFCLDFGCTWDRTTSKWETAMAHAHAHADVPR